jgi:hypothetical protein
VSFAAITLCVAFQQVFIGVSVYVVMTQSGNVWIHPRIGPEWRDLQVLEGRLLSFGLPTLG